MPVSFNLRDKLVSMNDIIDSESLHIVQKMLNDGDIHHLSIGGIDHKLLPLLNLEHLTGISISNIPCFDLGFLAGIRKLKSLRLSFEGSSFGKKIMLNTIPRTDTLQSLTLARVKGLKDLPAFINLNEINMRAVTDEHLDFLESYPAVRDVFISGGHLTGYNKLVQAKNLARLRIIQSRKVDFDNIASEKALNHSLKILELSHCPSLTRFDFLQRFAALKYMDISSCNNLISLRGIENCPQLEVVNISECKSKDKNLQYLSAIKKVFVGISYTKEEVKNFEKDFTGNIYSLGKYDKGNFDYLEHYTRYYSKSLDGFS